MNIITYLDIISSIVYRLRISYRTASNTRSKQQPYATKRAHGPILGHGLLSEVVITRHTMRTDHCTECTPPLARHSTVSRCKPYRILRWELGSCFLQRVRRGRAKGKAPPGMRQECDKNKVCCMTSMAASVKRNVSNHLAHRSDLGCRSGSTVRGGRALPVRSSGAERLHMLRLDRCAGWGGGWGAGWRVPLASRRRPVCPTARLSADKGGVKSPFALGALPCPLNRSFSGGQEPQARSIFVVAGGPRCGEGSVEEGDCEEYKGQREQRIQDPTPVERRPHLHHLERVPVADERPATPRGDASAEEEMGKLAGCHARCERRDAQLVGKPLLQQPASLSVALRQSNASRGGDAAPLTS